MSPKWQIDEIVTIITQLIQYNTINTEHSIDHDSIVW